MRWKRHTVKALTAALLLAPLAANASSPAVNVGLKASWSAAPYMLELLETAASENPASYYPLLSAIYAGEFKPRLSSDEAFYTEFVRLATSHGYLTDPDELASFNFALSIHAAAPRIEAHYQYYEQQVIPKLGDDYNPECEAWVQWGHKQLCNLAEDIDVLKEPRDEETLEQQLLPFDRTIGDEGDKPVAILYISDFMDHLDILKKQAENGNLVYRVRYRRPFSQENRPVMLSGYGVELALKKTDYMVMDDRDVSEGADENAKEGAKEPKSQTVLDDDDESQDIQPLQGKDLITLGYKAASFVMASENPFETLQKLLQDFPKHQAKIAATETNEEMVEELGDNWDMLFGPGVNAIFINGQQMEDSQLNAFALLEHLRRERKLISGFNKLGLNTTETLKLLAHEALAKSKADKTQRFDYRDTREGGDIIWWLNDLEKDPRYKEFNPSVLGLLRRVMPGAIHPVKKNIHQIVFPVDYSNRADLMLISQQLRVYVTKKVAMRFGLVPITTSKEAIDQAKVIYHFQDNYGLQWTLKYIDQSLVQKVWPKPSKKVFDEVVKAGTLLEGKTALSLEEVLASEDLNNRIERAKKWGQRLGINGATPMIFLNGQSIPKDDEWADNMHPKLSADIQLIQQATYQRILTEDSSYPDWYLEDAVSHRNPYIFPESEADVKQINVAEITETHKDVFNKLPKINSNTIDRTKETSIWVVGDFDGPDGNEFLTAAGEMQMRTPGTNLVLINNPALVTEKPTLSTLLYHFQQVGPMTEMIFQQILLDVRTLIEKNDPQLDHVDHFMAEYSKFAKDQTWAYPDHIEAGTFWGNTRRLLASSGLKPGERGFIVNGRVVGPIPATEPFGAEDLSALVEYERRKRIEPVLKAAEELGVVEKVTQVDELGLAILTNQVALAGVPESPLGILDDPDLTRIDIKERVALSYKHSGFTVGSNNNATIHILASIDPASEKSQKWVPLLKVISEMSGVYLELYLNPARAVQEPPVKRFYRHVLRAAPEFDEKGRTIDPRARFENIPEKVLLSFSMDVPPSWLVTSKECIYDLDNLMVGSLKDRLRGADIEALYELRNILIEGHSRDLGGGGGAPQGAQLVLGTEQEPHQQDTIIMANLGYFQLKASPGLWTIKLMEGRSKEIYHIDTLGTKGPRAPVDQNEKPEVALMSFQGATLFPRLSRNPGMENQKILVEDVEESEPTGAVGAAKKWFKKAENLLGVGHLKADLTKKKQADINIFSVASGHLYERFLNIMMLSVMKHTDKTVKFWFIENFLSPSFKDFIPVMAKEYGFTYELVTYKWPHWLRAQKEKQREIWGYKILFLDVLFPLDLDKVIFVDADQIVRTDLKELVDLDLNGAPYGFTPMCDSRKEIEGFRFWKQGYWKQFLRGLPYHISALYVVDLKRFRQIAAGDRLRQQYHTLSADPNSLANLDQDLPNHMQGVLPIHSLPQEWLWCETWCSDESLKDAKTIDLCNNPMTKEPKLDRARRQVPEWTAYDNEVAQLAKRTARERNDGEGAGAGAADAVAGHLEDALKESEEKAEKEAKVDPELMVEKNEEKKAEEKEEAKRIKDEL